MTTTVIKNKLTCFCSRKPLLAMYGLDDKNRPYVHVKVWKQRRVFAEFIAYGGEVSLSCRECFRWHKIIFKHLGDRAELREVQIPQEVKQQEAQHDSSTSG